MYLKIEIIAFITFNYCPSIIGYFDRYPRCANILILEILNVFLWLKFQSDLISNNLSCLWMDTNQNILFPGGHLCRRL